jgi:hypothetical protein
MSTNPAMNVYNLIERGMPVSSKEINATDGLGSTALHYTLDPDYGFFDEQIVKRLIEQGADVNAVNLYGRTPLHNYARNEDINIHIVDYLLKHGAKINAIDSEGNTPLHYIAIDSYDLDLYKYFIDHGAKIDINSKYGESVIGILRGRTEEGSDDEDILEIYNYVSGINKLKQTTSEIPYLPPSKSFSGGKQYLKAKKHFESNRFGKKRNTFTSELKYLKRLK